MHPSSPRYLMLAGVEAGYTVEQVYLAALALNVVVGKMDSKHYYWFLPQEQ